MSHTAVDSRQPTVANHDVKDPEKSGPSTKVFNPTSSFDVYGDEEEAASKYRCETW
jgi:hypothetical protein